MAFPPLPLPAPGQENWAPPLNDSLAQLNSELSELDDLADTLPAIVTATESARDDAIAAAAQAEAIGTTNDTLTASLVDDTASATRTSLNNLFLVYRLYSGTSYPARVPGAVNVFLGPVDPGLAMAAGDYWANPGLTTLPAVVAAVQDTGSDLRKAIQADSIYVPVTDLVPEDSGVATFTILGSSPNQRGGRVMPSTGVTRLLGGIKVPNTWVSFRVVPHWQHTTASPTAGNVGWTATVTRTPHTGGVNTGTFYTPNASQNITVSIASPALTPPAGGIYSFMVARNANAAEDTFEYPIQLLGVEFVKEA